MSDTRWRDERTDASVRAELDRAYPERTQLRPTDVAGLQQAFDVVDALWAPTLERARAVDSSLLEARVNGEYSFVETLRHLLFAQDAWLRDILELPDPFHQWSLPPDLPAIGPPVRWAPDTNWVEAEEAPGLKDVLEVRQARRARVREYLSHATASDLARRVAAPVWAQQPGTPIVDCFRLILSEEWWHHHYAARDLAVLSS